MALVGANTIGRATTSGGKSLAQLKEWFFDREKILKAADKATVKALSKFGAFVRRRAQTSMKRRNKASAPGQPPSAHGNAKQGQGKAKKSKYTGAWLRELLFFSYDPLTRTVVVGPLGFKGSGVPALHEFGGTAQKWGVRTIHGVRKRVVIGTATYPPRPYMKPALDAELPKFAEQFRGTIGG